MLSLGVAGVAQADNAARVDDVSQTVGSSDADGSTVETDADVNPFGSTLNGGDDDPVDDDDGPDIGQIAICAAAIISAICDIIQLLT